MSNRGGRGGHSDRGSHSHRGQRGNRGKPNQQPQQHVPTRKEIEIDQRALKQVI